MSELDQSAESPSESFVENSATSQQAAEVPLDTTPSSKVSANASGSASVYCDDQLLNELASIPDKMAFKIGEVADIVGVKQDRYFRPSLYALDRPPSPFLRYHFSGIQNPCHQHIHPHSVCILNKSGIDDDRMRIGVGHLIGNLTDREQLILRLRYGLSGEEEHTLEQIGQSLGLSRERVRQLEARALKKLRDTMPAQRLHPVLEP